MATGIRQEPNMDGSLQDTFDWLADRYLTQTQQISLGRYRQWMNQVTRLVCGWQPHSIVDVGCGPGYLLDQIASTLPKCQLAGVDYSSRMLHHVPSNIRTYHQSLRVWAETTRQQFDVIMMTFFLRDQPDPLTAVKQLYKRLNPAGHLLILETHTPQGLRGVGFNIYFHHMLPWWGDARLTRDWPMEHGPSPYHVLSSSHRRWMQNEPLPEVLSRAGYHDITRHTSTSDVVALWTAQP